MRHARKNSSRCLLAAVLTMIFAGTIAKLPLGLLKLKPLKADISPDDVIRSASFEASLIIPSGSNLDPSLKRHPSPCPRPFR
jgi:hypothetical protein